MAESTRSCRMAGFECVFVEEPPKALQSECPACLLVLREPYQATCCGKSFCKECIVRFKTNNRPCPACRERDFNLFHNKGLQQSLYDFKVYCSHKSKGCEWRGELRELDKHLNSEPPTDKSLEGCPFTVIKCPLNHTGCEVKLPRKEMKEHVNNDLLRYVLKLTKDNESFSTRLQAVEEEKQQLKQSVIELQGKLEKLEGAQHVASHTGHPIGPVEFTMTNFEQHKGNEWWYSPPFYTHYHGYEMCLCVWPNGFGSGKGTHLGVTVHLMRGEFDDHLKWPFRGDITFVLLDQDGAREDRNDDVNVVHFNEKLPDMYCTRVVGKEVNSSGWGISKVIPLSDLQPKYLKNDCIKLRIMKLELTQ